MKINGWGYLIWLVGLLWSTFGCTAGTPPPPAVTITPSPPRSISLSDVTWINRDDELLVSFYMKSSHGNAIPVAGTAHLQISKPRKNGCVKDAPVPVHNRRFEEFIVDGNRCLLFSINKAAQPDDFMLEFKRYIDVEGDSGEWQSGWHYWYTFVVPYNSALENLGDNVEIEVWYEYQDGSSSSIWRWDWPISAGRLQELEPFEPGNYE